MLHYFQGENTNHGVLFFAEHMRGGKAGLRDIGREAKIFQRLASEKLYLFQKLVDGNDNNHH
jgi:hypothetical protein